MSVKTRELLCEGTELAAAIYRDFLTRVVDARVLTERTGPHLSDALANGVEKGTHVDPRVPRLMSLSGKGGWSADPVLRERYAHSRNVTLLDHLLSVVRGALLLCALDRLLVDPDLPRERLCLHLRIVAAIAFLHDLDKMLGLARDTPLPPADVADAMQRYGLAAFVGEDEALASDQWRVLIEFVEDTQAHRNPPMQPLPHALRSLPPYVALADKLDGKWLAGGLDDVLKYLASSQVLHSDLLRHWQPIRLFDPHHPFLLDELQRSLVAASSHVTGVPPLIETHLDGELQMLLPTAGYAEIVERALGMLAAALPFELELVVSNRGVPALYNGQPTHAALEAFLHSRPLRELARLFLVKAAYREHLTLALDALLGPLSLAPRWPKGTVGALCSPYAGSDDYDVLAASRLRDAAHLALLLNLNLPSGPRTGLPDYDARETALLTAVDVPRPEWLELIEDGASRRALTALWVVALAADDEALQEAVWSDEGLLAAWLEGRGSWPAFSAALEGRGSSVVPAVQRHLRALLAGGRVTVADEQARGRCLFTDAPVAFEETISEADGLYEIKVSAFSGRDGRPESLTQELAHTNVGPVSLAEHKLRARTHPGGKTDGVPTLISSPGTLGLFGGLAFDTDAALGSLSVYDLARLERGKGRIVYDGFDIYRSRYRLARYERLPEKLAEQADLLRLLLQAAGRLGRPLHVFRGLPTPQRAFFHCDALAGPLAELLGSSSLRLEELPEARRKLDRVLSIFNSHGLGHEVAVLYMRKATRFAAACLAWCHLRDRHDEKKGEGRTLAELHTDIRRALEGSPMNDTDAPLIRLGRAAAGIQIRPNAQAAANEELAVWKLCLETAAAARAVGQADDASLIHAITGELETHLVRRRLAASRTARDGVSLLDGCQRVAELFVREVWSGPLKRRAPSQNARRVLGSMYRVAFLHACRE